MLPRSFAILLTYLGLTSARAEYRVFLLKIERVPASAAPARFVESTLDPEQYRGYYPVGADEVVTYVDTWRCRGRTNSLPLCPNPRSALSPLQSPDSTPQTPSRTP